MSLRIDEDGSSDEDEKEPVDEQDLPAPESPLPNVAPFSNILDFIVDAADSDESTADAKKKSRKAISFPYIGPATWLKTPNKSCVIGLLKPEQFQFDVCTHVLSLPVSVWQSYSYMIDDKSQSKASSALAASAVTVAASAVSAPASARPTRQRVRSQLTTSDLIPTSDDHGFGWQDFARGQAVLVFFKDLIIGGQIVARGRDRQSLSVQLDTDLRDTPVVVSHRILQPLITRRIVEPRVDADGVEVDGNDDDHDGDSDDCEED